MLSTPTDGNERPACDPTSRTRDAHLGEIGGDGMTTVTASDRVVRDSQLMVARLDPEIVILSKVTNNYLALDDIGCRVWDLLETPQHVDELCQLLGQEFSATPEQVCVDLLPFLSDLTNEGVVQVVTSQPAAPPQGER
jgi:hypothetical protein